MSALTPIRPTFLRSPPPAMPTTRVEKIRGAMIDLMRLRKMSRRTKRLFPHSGWTYPSTPPATRPIRIQVVSDRRYQGLRGVVTGWAMSVMALPPRGSVGCGDGRAKDSEDPKDGHGR